MLVNPLFAPDDDNEPKHEKRDNSYVVPNRHGRKIEPLHANIVPEGATAHVTTNHHQLTHGVNATVSPQEKGDKNPAAQLIRRKLETMYDQEPAAKAEIQAIPQGQPVRSKHQQFMYDLSTSGRSLAQIQTEWHRYYAELSDAEKHQVWQEFYSANSKNPSSYTTYTQQVQAHPQTQPSQHVVAGAQPQYIVPAQQQPLHLADQMLPGATTPHARVAKGPRKELIQPKHKEAAQKAAGAVKKKIVKRIKVNAATQAKAWQHIKSLFVGLSSAAVVALIILFGLFNEVVVTPFIQPSSRAGTTPIILGANNVAPSSDPEVIIPKINVEIPTNYSVTSNNENDIENALEDGVVHYPSTVLPGEQGNSAFFGHSSNNIFNPGKYKFAFVLLHELVPGDIFYLTKGNKVYTYRVFDKQIVDPSNVSVLNDVPGKIATATLITCDPPGTSLRRLVVWGEQISPDPTSATTPTVTTTAQPKQINGNGPSLWTRIVNWAFNKKPSTASGQ